MSNEKQWAEVASSIRRVPEARLANLVVARLEEMIKNGDLKPGDKIPPERELAEMFDVSRNSIREALHELDIRGRIDRRPGRGTVVLSDEDGKSRLELEQMRELGPDVYYALDFRRVIEPEIAAHAAQRATNSDLLRLHEILRLMELETSLAAYVKLDQQFHVMIAEACHNPRLAKLVELSSEWIEATRKRCLETKSQRNRSLRSHQLIYEAIANGDSSAASAAMASHIEEVIAYNHKLENGSGARKRRTS